jgi:hypothetical protein
MPGEILGDKDGAAERARQLLDACRNIDCWPDAREVEPIAPDCFGRDYSLGTGRPDVTILKILPICLAAWENRDLQHHASRWCAPSPAAHREDSCFDAVLFNQAFESVASGQVPNSLGGCAAPHRDSYVVVGIERLAGQDHRLARAASLDDLLAARTVEVRIVCAGNAKQERAQVTICWRRAQCEGLRRGHGSSAEGGHKPPEHTGHV